MSLYSLVPDVCEVVLPILGVIVGLSAIIIIGLLVALCICRHRSCCEQQYLVAGDHDPEITLQCKNQKDGGITSTLKNFSDSRNVLGWLVTVVNTLDQQVAKNNTDLCRILNAILADLTKEQGRAIQFDSEDNTSLFVVGSDEELNALMIKRLKAILK